MKYEKKLYQKILAFSISHDHQTVRMYSYYPIIEGGKTRFYCYPIKTFNFTRKDSKERWTVYKFTKNIYNI